MKTIHRSMRITPEERETHLWYDPIDKIWRMESNIPKHFNKAQRQGWTPVSQTVYEDNTVCAMSFTAPENAITIRNPNKKREMSESQKASIFGRKNDDLDDDFEDEDLG